MLIIKYSLSHLNLNCSLVIELHVLNIWRIILFILDRITSSYDSIFFA